MLNKYIYVCVFLYDSNPVNPGEEKKCRWYHMSCWLNQLKY
jgi:hypothetical protein